MQGSEAIVTEVPIEQRQRRAFIEAAQQYDGVVPVDAMPSQDLIILTAVDVAMPYRLLYHQWSHNNLRRIVDTTLSRWCGPVTLGAEYGTILADETLAIVTAVACGDPPHLVGYAPSLFVPKNHWIFVSSEKN